MNKPDPNKVRNWNEVRARIDPETEKKFQEKLKENGDSQSSVIRKAVRNYNKD